MHNNRYREEELENLEQVDSEEEPEEIVNEMVSPEQVDDHQQSEIFNENNKNKKEKKLRQKIDELEKIVEELKVEKAHINNEMLKDRAELENFKRRSNEERMKDRKYALQDFLTEFINTVDIFDKATNVNSDDEKLKKYLLGFAMINQQIFSQLENYGVKKIDALNKEFDPSVHMALDTTYDSELPEGTVVEVITTGYMYKDRVLRPSMVKVSTQLENNHADDDIS